MIGYTLMIESHPPRTVRHYTQVQIPSMKSDKRPKNRHSLRHDRHSVSLLTDHLVFCTKYRAPVLTPEIAERCEEIIRSVADDLHIKIRRMAVNLEHVHIFYVYPPKLSTSYIAMKFKGVSSRLLRKEFPELTKKIRKTNAGACVMTAILYRCSQIIWYSAPNSEDHYSMMI